MTLDRDPFLGQRPPLTENGQRRQSQTGVKILPSCKFLSCGNNGTYMGGVRTCTNLFNVHKCGQCCARNRHGRRGFTPSTNYTILCLLYTVRAVSIPRGDIPWGEGGIVYKPFEYSLQMDTNCWLQGYFDWVKGVCAQYAWA